MKTVYVVGQVKTVAVMKDSRDDTVFEIPITWAKGMIGALSVFPTKEAAEEYLDGCKDYPILEMEVSEPILQ